MRLARGAPPAPPYKYCLSGFDIVSKVKSQKSKVKSQKSKVKSQKLKVKSQKLKVKSQNWSLD
ncbi:MAG: hypothetical protein F6J93_36945 [Oscillatoria sp. SIO1A7]|nr:hypothetical protein [Oscillatoria sp. SIO1A7]